MSIELKVPTLPESVADATVAKIYKVAGDVVAAGDNLCDLETDKVMLEVPASSAGTIGEWQVSEGAIVMAGQVLVSLDETAVAAPVTSSVSASSSVQSEEEGVVASLSPAVRRLIEANDIDVQALKDAML